MAEILLQVVAEVLFKRVSSLISEEVILIWGFEEQLTKLRGSLTMIRAVLRDAERRQVKDDAVKLWLKRLKDVAYDAADVLDEIDYEIIRRKVALQKKKARKVRLFFSSPNPISFRLAMVQKIKEVNKLLKRINEEANHFGLQRGGVDMFTSQVSFNRESDSFLDNCEVIGRENEASEIVDTLVDSTNQEVLSVISIVGMAGLGKTTLAKLIHNDERITRHFHERIWVCVSDNFGTKRLLIDILKNLKENYREEQSKEAILRELEKEFGDKKYLLVLDDVWNESPSEWDHFKSCLAGVNKTKGNYIVVTTRKQQVESIMGTRPPHYLKALSTEDCWSIFKQKAFATGGAPFTPELEEIGYQLVEKCQGVPLAAMVLGGMMFCKKGREEWLDVQKSGFQDLHRDENRVRDILKLSFDNLPSPFLKQCFAYCSIFQADCNIDKEKLIQLWTAVGFLQTGERSDMMMEDIGNEYFNALLWNSLFQDVMKDMYGNITGCKMHGIVFELARSVSESEVFCSESSVVINIPHVRHLGLYSDGQPVSRLLSKEKAAYLHTLILKTDVPKSMIKDFKCLCVLNFTGGSIDNLQNSVTKLMHLRYLDLTNTHIRVLPKLICKLYNLQTLRLEKCFRLEELPNELTNLKSLRHLHLPPQFMDYDLPLGIGQLTCLQTLEFYSVGQAKGRQIEELGHLKHLRGKLVIHNLEQVSDKEEAQRANLIEKINLHELIYSWSCENRGITNDEDVLEGLQPSPNIKSLSVWYFMGDNFPTWMMKMALKIEGRGGCLSLDNLVAIELHGCERCHHIPMLGQLPHLKNLVLRGMIALKSIDCSFYGHNHYNFHNSTQRNLSLFPSLTSLALENMPNLEEWAEIVDGRIIFPLLEKLRIWWCPKLSSVPTCFPGLKKLEVVRVNSMLPLANICTKGIPTLTELRIDSVSQLTCLPDGLLRNNNNLTNLKIEMCPMLTHVVPTMNDCFGSLLRSLHIYGCEKLTCFPDSLHTLLYLEQLWVSCCPNLNSVSSIQGLRLLQKLSIYGCEGLTCLPSGTLQSYTLLHTLIIEDCGNLISLPELKHLSKSLSYLNITKCNNLNGLPEGLGCLTCLTDLRIGPFSETLTSFPTLDGIQNTFPSLRIAKFYGWDHWEYIPDQLQHFISLTDITLDGFGIDSLPDWFKNFSYLRSVCICDCKKLKNLPTMDHLADLDWLRTINCPLIKR